MQVLQTKTPLITTLHKFAVRDGTICAATDRYSLSRLTTFIPGLASLWSGISASILRQSTYSTARFGLYNLFARQLQQASGQSRLSSTSTIACAGLAGGLAGVIGNPAEVVLVRMCADGAKPTETRFRYSNAGTGLYRIWREEGVRVFGRGISANIVRSVLMSSSSMAPSDRDDKATC
jgi:solute carrier family 25 (mitochondrial dicarboxylate transporter), member 10